MDAAAVAVGEEGAVGVAVVVAGGGAVVLLRKSPTGMAQIYCLLRQTVDAAAAVVAAGAL